MLWTRARPSFVAWLWPIYSRRAWGLPQAHGHRTVQPDGSTHKFWLDDQFLGYLFADLALSGLSLENQAFVPSIDDDQVTTLEVATQQLDAEWALHVPL